jgi:two-component system, response regulator / RNA-binding antiterminator
MVAKRKRPSIPAPAGHAAPGDTLALRVLLIDEAVSESSAPFQPDTTTLRNELARLGCEVAGVIDSPTLIHDMVERLRPDVVIVNAQSPSRDTLEHLAVMNARSPRPVVVFSADAHAELMRRAIAAGVSAYVVDGLQPNRVQPVLQVAIARFEQDARLRAQLTEAQHKLAARRAIERAKGILMAQGGLDEAAAHARLRKMAMDRGLRMEELAAQIVAARDLLDAGA